MGLVYLADPSSKSHLSPTWHPPLKKGCFQALVISPKVKLLDGVKENFSPTSTSPLPLG